MSGAKRTRPGLGCPPPTDTYAAVVEERDADGLYVVYVPAWPGAHSHGATPEELQANLREVIAKSNLEASS